MRVRQSTLRDRYASRISSWCEYEDSECAGTRECAGTKRAGRRKYKYEYCRCKTPAAIPRAGLPLPLPTLLTLYPRAWQFLSIAQPATTNKSHCRATDNGRRGFRIMECLARRNGWPHSCPCRHGDVAKPSHLGKTYSPSMRSTAPVARHTTSARARASGRCRCDLISLPYMQCVGAPVAGW